MAEPDWHNANVLFFNRKRKPRRQRNLPDPGVLALEITEDLEAALAQFAENASDLKR
jgi:hypothetical protein